MTDSADMTPGELRAEVERLRVQLEQVDEHFDAFVRGDISDLVTLARIGKDRLQAQGEWREYGKATA